MADLSTIEHLIILTMENRSFDHYLGSLAGDGHPDVNGLQTLWACPDLSGNAIQSHQLDAGAYTRYGDVPHEWKPSHDCYNGATNDGFVQSYQRYGKPAPGTRLDPAVPMGFYTRQELPVLYKLCDEFTVCDQWHSSCLSSTWPNRKYLHSGKRDKNNDTGALPPLFPGFETTPIWEVIEKALDSNGRKMTWRCYFSDLPFLAFWYRFAATHLNCFEPIEAFVSDCMRGTLPTFSIIDPPFSLADDHPPHDPRLGQKFIELIVDALSNSPSWENTALLILYDEFGGFYDHVVPPSARGEDSEYGFRVPALVVSKYAKKGVAKTLFDHTSVMQSIKQHPVWGVNLSFDSEFGNRWMYSNPIWHDCFDFSQSRAAGIYTGEPLSDINWAKDVHTHILHPPGWFEETLERAFLLPELKRLDRRNQVLDSLVAMEHQVVNAKRMAMQDRAAPGFYAVCPSCGWTGSREKTEIQAEDDGEQHSRSMHKDRQVTCRVEKVG